MNNSSVSQSIPESPPSTLLDSVLSSLQDFSSFSQVLRTGGALLVAAAMSLFLLEDWKILDDLQRFYMMLGQTAVLALIGFGLSVILKEQKGARAFFGLGILSVLTNMTTLGALFYSSMQGLSSAEGYPVIAQWQAMELSSLVVAVGAAFVVAVPLLLFAFSVMARPIAKPLTLVLLVTSALLLIPFRGSLSTSALAAIAAIMPFLALKRWSIQEYALKTLEARFAIATLFLPLVIIVIRYFWLYSVDEVAILMVCSLAFAGNYAAIARLKESSHWGKSLFDWVCVALGGCVTVAILSIVEQWLSWHLTVLLASLLFAAFSMLVAQQSKCMRNAILIVAALQLLAWHGLILLSGTYTEHATMLLSIMTGVSIMVLGKMANTSWLFILGALVSVLMILLNLLSLFNGVDFANWVTMIVVGIAIIVTASILERYGAVIRLKYSQWFKA